MTSHVFGHWVAVNPEALVKASKISGVEVLPSPYDVPLALRINEGDPNDPSYVVEMRYLGRSNEKTRTEHVADFDIEVGSSSGRVYRLLVDAKYPGTTRFNRLERAAVAVGSIDSADCLGGRAPFKINCDNARMVSRAVEIHGNDLKKQLDELGRPPEEPRGASGPSRKTWMERRLDQR